MQWRQLHTTTRRILAIPAMTLLVASAAWAAPNETVLHPFNGGVGGGQPNAALIADSQGNLYGTTYAGGNTTNCTGGCGTVFELIPNGAGKWTEKLVHIFSGGIGGSNPSAALIFDGLGNLYGTTVGGGANGFGIVFELIPGANGTWSGKILHSFTGTVGGGSLFGDLVFDSLGNLYGTANSGGAYGFGTVFKLTPSAKGVWGEQVLHPFGSNKNDGARPNAGLIFDSLGNLYGTTSAGGSGGSGGNGTVFELTLGTNGHWTEQIIYSFAGGSDGSNPLSDLIFDSLGNLYGTTYYGGTGSCASGTVTCGTVFQLTPGSNGVWTKAVLHQFKGGNDGGGPVAGLVFDTSGNLYGTTTGSGGTNAGSVFELIPGTNGWGEKVLHGFSVGSVGGAVPRCRLILDSLGNLYGTASAGGGGGAGLVFQITP